MKRFGTISLHVAYWAMYLLLLFLFVLMIWLQTHHVLTRSVWHMVSYWPGWILLVLPELISFYIFYNLLFPRYLKTKRLSRLILSGLLTVVISSLLAMCIWGFYFHFRFGPGGAVDALIQLLVLSAICFVHGVLALVIRGFISWYEEIHLKDRLRQKNQEMELALIRSQLNPHFLFNTLNNIDVLIQKDAQRASVYLNQLSDILRFMLYETKTEEISIQQELQYIDKYIQLQKIRTAHPEYISYTIEGMVRHQLVAPMLFIPFIENAFKHAEKKAANAIRVQFTFAEDSIVFVCENSYTPGAVERGGLGNDLIRRRLSLLYPGRHQLDIDTNDNIYKAILTLSYAN